MQGAILERRQQARMKTAGNADCHLGGLRTSGLMLDLSEGGLFVGPAIGWQDETFVKHTPFARLVQIGDDVVLSYREAWYAPEVLVVATVRWVGYSPTHQCHGFGFEFLRDESPPQRAAGAPH